VAKVLTLYRLTAMACLFLALPTCFAQSKPSRLSLCVLQGRITAGNHLPVEVAGVYSAGLDVGPLVDLGCAAQGYVG